MKRVRRVAAACRGIRQRLDRFQVLNRRARPPVRDDERQRVFMFRADVDEVNIQPVNFGNKLWQSVEPRFAPAPVVFRPPIARELLNRRELEALRSIRDWFALRPLGSVDAPSQIGKLCVGEVHVVRTNSDRVVTNLSCGGTHSGLLFQCVTTEGQRAHSNA